MTIGVFIRLCLPASPSLPVPYTSSWTLCRLSSIPVHCWFSCGQHPYPTSPGCPLLSLSLDSLWLSLRPLPLVISAFKALVATRHSASFWLQRHSSTLPCLIIYSLSFDHRQFSPAACAPRSFLHLVPTPDPLAFYNSCSSCFGRFCRTPSLLPNLCWFFPRALACFTRRQLGNLPSCPFVPSRLIALFFPFLADLLADLTNAIACRLFDGHLLPFGNLLWWVFFPFCGCFPELPLFWLIAPLPTR